MPLCSVYKIQQGILYFQNNRLAVVVNVPKICSPCTQIIRFKHHQPVLYQVLNKQVPVQVPVPVVQVPVPNLQVPVPVPVRNLQVYQYQYKYKYCA